MILSTHFIAGAAVANYTDSPLILVIAPIVVHFILDMIPHWEYVQVTSELKNKIPQIFVDLISGPIILLIISYLVYGFDLKKIIWLLMGGVIGMVPDGFTLLYTLSPKNKVLKKVFDFHIFIHNDLLLTKKLGLPIQIAIDLAAVALITLPKL